ncbi:Fe-S oxidoreductase, partial [Actinocorallia sp. API 0066]|nr:Fe-S oxidoreductase [Actinocorallia sp. API 0066]
AHFFVMWAFFLLATVYIEAGVALLFGIETHVPILQTWGPVGFVQDFIAVMCAVGLAVFAGIRIKNAPKTQGRRSRFFGSHLGGAWLILFMIFNVIWTMFFFRGTLAALETVTGEHYFPFGKAAFASYGAGLLFDGLSAGTLEVLASVGLLLHIGVALAFLVIVVNSKHLHIFLAPLNVMFKRRPNGLGAAQPVLKPDGEILDFEEADPDEDLFGRSRIEDFTWKGF